MSQSDSHSHSHADPKPPADHELTPLETYFDELFNEHMVLPQPLEQAPPIEGVKELDQAPSDHRTEAS